MSSSPTLQEEAQSQWQAVLRKAFCSRWTFVILQVFDLLTTLAAFHLGANEVNRLVARLTLEFGRTGGVVVSKLIAVAIAMGVRKRLWIVNLFYAGIVLWNIAVIVSLLMRRG